MTSDEIFTLIEAIAATSSKTGKQELIEKYSDDKDFLRVLRYALDPFKTYGIAKMPPIGTLGGEGRCFGHGTWALLDDLASRELSGNAAKDAVSIELSALSTSSRQLLWRIITKDLRAGFSESTVNKAISGLVPTFDCMLAHKFEPKRIKKWPMVAEPKLDGVRVLAFVQGTDVKFFSRSGKEFATFDHLKVPLSDAAEYLRKHHGFTDVVFDGEVVSGSFNKTVSEVRKKDEQAVDAEFHVFDVLTADLFRGLTYRPVYHERRKFVEGAAEYVKGAGVKAIPRYLVSSEHEIHNLYESVRARGLEGLIIKDPAAIYERKRSHAWMKIKAEESVDVEIVGFEEGTGKYEGMLGALIVDHEGVRVNVGTGLSDSQRSSFWDDQHLLVGRLCEVQYHEITPDGSLRHPRFIRFRDDKA